MSSRNGGRKAPSKKKSRRQNRGMVGTSRGAGIHVHMSPVASDYARVLKNPFTGPAGVCLPWYPAALTKKARVWAKGVMSTGTAGFGFVTFDPLHAAFNDSTAAVFSQAAFAGTTIDMAALGTAGAQSNSEYSVLSLGLAPDQMTVKVVSGGIRLRYIGTELNRGGQLVGFQDPNHTSLQTRTIAQIDAENESRRMKPDGKWKNVVFRPLDSVDSNFIDTMSTFTPADTDPSYFMGFAVQAPAGTTLTYEFEAYSNVEYLGRNVRGKTPSHVDPAGFTAVHASTNLGTSLLPFEGEASEHEANAVREAASYIAKHHSSQSGVQATSAIQAMNDVTSTIHHAANLAPTIASVASSLLDFFF